jgi:hypothetical protein
MHVDEVIGLHHDTFCYVCDAYDLLVLLVVLRIDWLYAAS